MLDTTPEADENPGLTPEQKALRQAARRVGRIVLTQSHKIAHPDASAQDIRAAVAAQKAHQVKLGKQILKVLEKSGATVSFVAAG